MIRNYLKIAWRNLVKNKVYSFINIAGLAAGMAVAMIIGLWIYDEMSANKHFKNYNRIYQVMMNQTFDGRRGSQQALPFPLAEELGWICSIVARGSMPAKLIGPLKGTAKRGRIVRSVVLPSLSLIVRVIGSPLEACTALWKSR